MIPCKSKDDENVKQSNENHNTGFMLQGPLGGGGRSGALSVTLRAALKVLKPKFKALKVFKTQFDAPKVFKTPSCAAKIKKKHPGPDKY